MKRGMMTLMAALSMAALMAAGCANKEVVKTEEPVVKVEAPAPVKPEAPPVEQPKVEQPQVVEQPKPPEQPAVAPAPAVTVFETIYFDFDKSDLRPDAREVLTKSAELLKGKNDGKIRIEGHCDERGSAEYNLALGERRANSALQYLLTLGVAPDKLTVISYGKEKPAVQGSDESAWSKNRRAEFVVVK